MLGPFWAACKCGDLAEAKRLHASGTGGHITDWLAFVDACANGHLEVAQWLVDVGGMHPYSVMQDAFTRACANGQLAVAKWLVGLDIVDIDEEDDYPFRLACANGQAEVAQWLHSLGHAWVSGPEVPTGVWLRRPAGRTAALPAGRYGHPRRE